MKNMKNQSHIYLYIYIYMVLLFSPPHPFRGSVPRIDYSSYSKFSLSILTNV